MVGAIIFYFPCASMPWCCIAPPFAVVLHCTSIVKYCIVFLHRYTFNGTSVSPRATGSPFVRPCMCCTVLQKLDFFLKKNLPVQIYVRIISLFSCITDFARSIHICRCYAPFFLTWLFFSGILCLCLLSCVFRIHFFPLSNQSKHATTQHQQGHKHFLF